MMQNYNCKHCGAVLYWEPNAGCLKCNFCENIYQISDFEDQTVLEDEVKEESLDENYVAQEVTEDMVVYECKTCAGEVVVLNTTMATICPYCGEAISITSKSVGEFRPELLIPFTRDKKEIMETYKGYVSKSLLTPKEFKEQHTIEKIQGLFVPFYLHTMTNRARNGFQGEIVSSSRIGNDKVMTHRLYDLSLDARGTYKRIPTDASKRIDNALMDSVEPFQYEALEQYNPAYMAGFMAEQVDDSKEDMKTRACDRCSEAMQEKARNSFSKYQSLSEAGSSNFYEDYESEYVMLPVWMLHVGHKDKKYTFAVNGQSGKVVGHLPIDKAKLAGIGVGAFVGIEFLVTLIFTIFA
ncbi:MAG: hypothetical protein IKJ16_07365 [Agathobacter sp.]|nr:hypothetical protein [Lachnospiraceae bacterium]MBR3812126.1 hypothetical protein [Agathobacter sp.]